jgi:GNAT superfamily N-acetyltransferase
MAEIYPDSEVERGFFTDAAERLLGNAAEVWAFFATANGARDVGLIALNECAANSTGGKFGEVSELYVVPEHRSEGVGALLLDAAISFGRSRGGLALEVGAPSPPLWQRTVDFHLRHGSHVVGPRLDLELNKRN